MEKVLVIIPTYNESENIQRVVELTLVDSVFDILVVDDSSPDGTADLVFEMMKTHPNRLFLEQRSCRSMRGQSCPMVFLENHPLDMGFPRREE